MTHFKWPLKIRCIYYAYVILEINGWQAEAHLWMYSMWICETVGSQRLTLYLVFTVLIYSFEKPAVLEMHGWYVEIKINTFLSIS